MFSKVSFEILLKRVLSIILLCFIYTFVHALLHKSCLGIHWYFSLSMDRSCLLYSSDRFDHRLQVHIEHILWTSWASQSFELTLFHNLKRMALSRINGYICIVLPNKYFLLDTFLHLCLIALASSPFTASQSFELFSTFPSRKSSYFF